VAWTLYDFANSAFSAIVQATIFPVYYAEAIVGNADGRGDFWWGLVGSVAMIVVALTSPLLGASPITRACASRSSSASRWCRSPRPRCSPR
jgi:UMF1 family MFS transporter